MQLPDFTNSLEFDQENYFGKEKYDQYKEYENSGLVNLNNVSEEDLYVAITNVKNRKKKDFIANIDSDDSFIMSKKVLMKFMFL